MFARELDYLLPTANWGFRDHPVGSLYGWIGSDTWVGAIFTHPFTAGLVWSFRNWSRGDTCSCSRSFPRNWTNAPDWIVAIDAARLAICLLLNWLVSTTRYRW